MTTQKNNNTSGGQTDTTPAMPLFYSKPLLLDSRNHANLSLREDLGYGFTREANAVPINLVECPQIAHFYPIAFAKDGLATPVAILGLRDQENLFVNKAGAWVQNIYIPSYVRRYPFILSEQNDGQQLSLCIDETKDTVTAGRSQPFFEADGGPTQLAKNAIEFCRSYHLAARQTIEFGKAIADSGLLVDRAAEINLSNGQRLSFSGFRIIDEEKFNKLPEKTLLEWRNKGWLAGAYAHLFSGLHWGTLTRMLNERMAPQG